jgi:hypothetical protein
MEGFGGARGGRVRRAARRRWWLPAGSGYMARSTQRCLASPPRAPASSAWARRLRSHHAALVGCSARRRAAATATAPVAVVAEPQALSAPAPATAAETARRFERDGFLVLPGAIDDAAERAAMLREIDEAVDTGRRKAGQDSAPTAYPALGALPAHPALVAALSALMPAGFAVQHLQCDRHEPGLEELGWHHDHLCSVTPAPGLLVYAFVYPSGLDGTIGDLLLLAGSHRVDAGYHRLGLASLFGTRDLPPKTATLDHAPPGTIVLLHGALLHARRAKRQQHSCSSQEEEEQGVGCRYFVDVSYCSIGRGERWPAYRYWRPPPPPPPPPQQQPHPQQPQQPEQQLEFGTTTMRRVGVAAEASLRKAGRRYPPSLFAVEPWFYDEASASEEESRARGEEARAGNA